jgi:capsular exopolysaccharide synthesis family protein
MSRLHGALHRASDGKAQILPPDAGIAIGEGMDASQPAFSVPWALDAQATPAAVEAAPSDRAGMSLLPTKSIHVRRSEAGERLVVAEGNGDLADVAVAAEQYRKLAAALHHAQADRGLKLIIVTSANPGEGKSLTASNLALTLSESYKRRVLLIDADLRRPSLHDVFGLPNGSGLSDGLTRDSLRELAVQEVSARLSVLTSGRPLEDPTGALTSGQMTRILEEARATYDWAIIDTPPIGLLTDAKLLSEMVDGVLLVVEAARTPYPDLLRAIETVGRERLLGTVLNRIERVSGQSKYYASYYRRSETPVA